MFGQCKDASLRCNFSSAERRFSKSSDGDGIQPGKNHGFDFLVPGQRGRCGVGYAGDRVAHARVFEVFDARDQIADFAVHAGFFAGRA